MLWIFSVVVAFVGAIGTAFACGFSGAQYLIVLPIFIGYVIAVIALAFAFGFVCSLFVNKKKPVEKPSRFYTFLYNLINDFICESARIDLTINGLEKIDKKTRYLFVFNHRSKFDSMILSKKFKRNRILMISKPENFDIPMVGGVIHKAGFMPIDRDNDREAIKTVIKSANYLKSGKYSIGIAPEGTRNRDGINLLPFRNGAFKIALKAEAPIAVMLLNGTENIAKNFPFKSTKVTLDILRVYTPEEIKDMHTNAIGEEIACAMQEVIDLRNANQ